MTDQTSGTGPDEDPIIPPKPGRRRVAVLISGRGSNMRALLDAAQNESFPAEIVLVLSNKSDAKGLEVAASFGIRTAVVSHRDYPDREQFDAAVNEVLQDAEIEIVCLAGFMRLLTSGFVRSWGNRLLNIHPAILPSFKGAHGHRDALAAGVRIHGCTVHLVRPEMDSGPILLQAAVPVLPDDDEASLAARVLVAEHIIYPLALGLLAQGRISVQGEKITIDRRSLPDDMLKALSGHDAMIVSAG